MHRVRITLFALILTATSVASAQTDSGGAPAFHAGQWATRFQIANGFVGVGALHFSTPNKAWLLAGTVSGAYQNDGSPDESENGQAFSALLGRRWYRPGAARVRPFGGLGIGGSFSRIHQVGGVNTSTALAYGGNVYGEIGASVFFAPELSLGAAWSGTLRVSRNTQYSNGSLYSKNTSFSLTAGAVTLEGAFYF
jgi:hypothetical protein